MSDQTPTRTTKPKTTPEADVKLVIWDLDETYWNGTLSEGAVHGIPRNSQIVRELNRRGVVSAICSKNDLHQAKEELERSGEWELFVFPSVDWTPKGPRIAAMLQDMGLRPPNVLFVDDNVGNLREAEHYVPGIQTAEPHELAGLLARPSVKGKDDTKLSRLAQYRTLQAKVKARDEMGGSNEEFLISSNIRVGIHTDPTTQLDRLLELVNRSNQLNYTKQRFTRAEFESTLANEDFVSGYITARDNFGDHGICGFFVHDGKSLINFSFSCRILNMGIENWVYQELGALPLEIVGEVATPLDSSKPITWVTAQRDDESQRVPAAAQTSRRTGRVLLKGGCDLSVVLEHLGGDIQSEFSFPSSTGALVHQEHTEILKRASEETLNDYGEIIDRLPFLDRAAYQSAIISSPEKFDTVVYSALMDFTQGLYRYRDTDFVVPFGEYTMDATSTSYQERYTSRQSRVGYTKEFFAWFSENFHFEGMVSPATVAHNIRWLREKLPETVRLIIINGAEIVSPSEAELDRHKHHAECNHALDLLVEEVPGIQLCDVRLVVSSTTDLTNNLRHYSRRAYFEISTQLSSLLTDSNVKSKSRAGFVVGELLAKVDRTGRRIVRSLINRVSVKKPHK
ncbi:HAD-IIIC family phosphatase [Rhodoglobus aureus]|uniref:HAD-IIIC family phosphatase n=1 Tax=Rhodoglobus aureus TaxID=191497 RepID=A0ABN1VSZ6_9MICO